ncbi:MAG: tetratricopeptide repeat protein [Alphaproteobacteria bacterium]|nr:tetratricopeptide repeat protein [Alphaproteobacteria bacterium]
MRYRVDGGRCRDLRAGAIILAGVLLLGGCAGMAGREQAAAVPAAPAPGIADRTLDLAERAIAEGRVGDAKVLLDRLAVAGLESPRLELAQGELQLALDQPKRALALFEAASRAEDLAAPALQGMGLALLRLGRTELALPKLAQAAKLDPALWRAWNGLGVCHDRAGEFAEAEQAYGKALAIHPRSALIRNNRGFSRLMQRRTDEAMADLAEALRLSPNLKPAQENMRLALAWKGDYESAISGVHGREASTVLNNVGYIAMLRGDLESAESYLLRAMEASPSFDTAASRNLSYLKTLGRGAEKPQ